MSFCVIEAGTKFLMKSCKSAIAFAKKKEGLSETLLLKS